MFNRSAVYSCVFGAGAFADSQRVVRSGAASQTDDDPVIRFKESIKVSAKKEPEDKQKVPVSVTAVSEDDARSNPAPRSSATRPSSRRIRSSPSSRRGSSATRGSAASARARPIPGITTYIDGVPQLNTNSSSLELLDIGADRIRARPAERAVRTEHARRPRQHHDARGRRRHAGRDVLGAVRQLRVVGDCAADASGPVIDDKLVVGFAFAHLERDGFTVNDLTGNDIDDRSAFSAKGQVLWTPTQNWEARVIVSRRARARRRLRAERSRDAARERRSTSARDFEGFTDRDIFSTDDPGAPRRRPARVLDAPPAS